MNVVESFLTEKEPRFRFSDLKIDNAFRENLKAPFTERQGIGMTNEPSREEIRFNSHENLLEEQDEEMKDPFEEPSAAG